MIVVGTGFDIYSFVYTGKKLGQRITENVGK